MNRVSVLSEAAQRVLKDAAKYAVLTRRKLVRPYHLFVALLMNKDSVGHVVLRRFFNVDPYGVARAVLGRRPERIDTVDEKEAEKVRISRELKDLLLEAGRLAAKSRSYYIGTEHLLLAYLQVAEKYNEEFGKSLKETVKDFDAFISQVLSLSLGPFRVIENIAKEGVRDGLGSGPIGRSIPIEGQGTLSFLKEFTSDIKRWISNNTLGVIVPRRELTDEVIKGLIGPIQKSVLLVGPSGVGKTYVVYDLALRIFTMDVPLALKDVRILTVNLPQIVATAKFPTDVEKRIMGILNEAYNNPNVILFFDDFQYLVSTVLRGGINMRMTLKGLLDSDKVRVIATISEFEYENLISQQDDLERLFKVIKVEPPDIYETKRIIKAYIDYVDSIYPLDFKPAAVDTMLKLADEYLTDMNFPDKAVRLLNALVAEQLFKKQAELKDIGIIERKIDEVELMKGRFIEMQKYTKAEQAQQMQTKLIEELKKLRESKAKASNGKLVIDVEDVKHLVASWTKIPVETLSSDDTSMLKNLEKVLKQYIVSQDEAVKKVAYAVKRGRLGIAADNRPWASFLFLGPTGVGKTELAKVLARHLFGDDKERLIQIDMSEFMEKHSVSKLIGSPPGYVGYEQGGMLTEKIKENPYAVVLFDEIEKAAPDVLNILLQILEEGHLTDSKGETVSFKNTIIIMTSNIGAEKIFEDRVLGFYRDQQTKYSELSDAYESMQEELLKELKKQLRPELLNRIDDIIIFRSLTKADSRKILEILIRELNARLSEIGLMVKLTPAAKRFLLERGFNPEYGARPLRRELQHNVENTVADYLLRHHRLYRSLRSDKPKTLVIDYNKRDKVLEVVE